MTIHSFMVRLPMVSKVMSSRSRRAAILSFGSLRMTRLLVRLVKTKMFFPVKKLVWFGSCFSLTPGSEPRRDERMAISLGSAMWNLLCSSEVRGVLLTPAVVDVGDFAVAHVEDAVGDLGCLGVVGDHENG